MAQNNWTATGPGIWTTAADWSLDHVPSTFEDAFIGTNGAIVSSGSNELVNSIGTGTNDVLDITSGSTFSPVFGTGPNANFGTIQVEDGSVLRMGEGTFFNPGLLVLFSVGHETEFLVDGVQATLDGGGIIAMSVDFNNRIVGGLDSEIDNKNNDIRGSATIESVFFDNQSGGILQTNNGLAAGVLDITADHGFQNEGRVFADNGGTLIFGVSGGHTTIFNFGLIEAVGASLTTEIVIAGNLTISSTGGRILLGGDNSSFDEIVSNGSPATLNLDGGTLDGAGVVGDSNLTLNVEQGAVVSADQAGGVLDLSDHQRGNDRGHQR